MNKDSKVFCMVPWIHMHIWPNGNVYPCCIAPPNEPYDNLKGSTLEKAWNSDKMKDLRINIKQDKASPTCKRCYKLEEHGNWSMRMDMNRKFGHHRAIINETLPDGHLDRMEMKYMDIRFSNICNFKCRTCGPDLSSTWFDDHQVMYPGDTSKQRVIKLFKEEDETWANLLKILPYIEEVYFAGGEPLAMPEHYQVLDYLIDNGRTDVRLCYNTNFSKTRHGKKDIFDYWKQFDRVSVGASLDDSGQRAELLRAGTKWDVIESNRESMIEKCPTAGFFIACTVSLYNAYHVIDFYLDWLEKGFVDEKGVTVNIVHTPEHMAVTVLPKEIKDLINAKYKEKLPLIKNEFVKGQFEGIINFMNSRDDSHLLPLFFSENTILDELRNENLYEIYPELERLRHYE